MAHELSNMWPNSLIMEIVQKKPKKKIYVVEKFQNVTKEEFPSVSCLYLKDAIEEAEQFISKSPIDLSNPDSPFIWDASITEIEI